MGIKVANNAFATLASSITNSATSITLTTGQGARFPSLGAGDYFYATLVDTSNNLEIVKCTARSTDVLTVVRAQESTTARAYSAGDRIEIRLTAATFTDATQSLPTQTGNAGKYLKTDGTNATWESISSVTPTSVSDQTNSSTGYFDLPSGTTAQRPGSPNGGMVRFNTTVGDPEWYDPVGAQWLKFSQGSGYSADVLLIGGGAGATGGVPSVNYGAGGAGGVARSNTISLIRGAQYTVNIGAGGAGSASGTPGNGGSTTLSGSGVSLTATGGGGVSASSFAGGSNADYSGAPGPGGTASGGGAGAGGNASGSSGGTGFSSALVGTSTKYGGGGAGLNSGNPGSVDGGGGALSNGTAGLGGGASGSPGGGSYSGGAGRVIISVLTTNYTGIVTGTPSVTTNGLYTILQFTSSGSYTA
jgi:hypothetical protein